MGSSRSKNCSACWEPLPGKVSFRPSTTPLPLLLHLNSLSPNVCLCSRLLDRRAAIWYIYVVGYIVLEDEMGDSTIDKQGTEEFPFPNGGKNMTTQSESTAPTRSIWKLDPNHTLVEFSGKHMMFTTVKGHFKNVNGTIVLDEADPSRSSVEVEIDASTLYSGVEYRDTHLKSPDFLDIQNYSVITFKSTRVEPESVVSFREKTTDRPYALLPGACSLAYLA